MDILIKNIGYLSKECNECLRTYIAMNDGDENLIGSLRVDCKAGSVDCPLVEVPPHDDLISRRDAIDAVYGYHINNHPMKELEELIPVIPASQGKENKPYYSDPTCKYNMWDGE